MWCWESRYFPINSSSQILVTPTIVHRREQWAPNYQEAKEREKHRTSSSEIAFARHFSYHHPLTIVSSITLLYDRGIGSYHLLSYVYYFQKNLKKTEMKTTHFANELF